MTYPTAEGFSLRAVARSAMILGGGVGGIQVLSIGREIFVAAKVGVSPELDALLIAMALPLTIAGVMTTGATDALVPAYLGVRRREGIEAARRLSGAILSWILLGGVGLAIVLVVLASQAVAITGPGLSSTGHLRAVEYVSILAPLAFVSAGTAVLSGISQAENRFAAISGAGLAGSATTLVVTIVAWDALGLEALAVASLVGPVVTSILLVISLARTGVTPRFNLRSGGPDIRVFLGQVAPLTLSGILGQLGVIADRAIASLLAPGAVSALRYADVLVRAPISAISPAWSSAIYPALVRAAQGAIPNELGTATERALRYATVVAVPVATMTAAVAPIAVAVAFERGAFGSSDVGRTAIVVAAFAPLIAILMTSPVLARAHLARGRGRILLDAAIIRILFNVGLDVVFGFWLGVAGIALSTSVTSVIVVVYFARRLATDQRFHLSALGRIVVLSIFASLIPALPIALIVWTGMVPDGTLPGLISLVVFGVVGLGAYGLIATALGMDELRTIWSATIGRRRTTKGALG